MRSKTLGSKTRRILGSVAAAGVAVAIFAMGAPQAAAQPGGGNVECSDFGLSELKLDDAPYAGQVIANSDISVTITAVKTNPDGEVVAFWIEDNDDVVRVIVKGSNASLMYWGAYLDSGEPFWSPFNDNGKYHHEISNIRFCY